MCFDQWRIQALLYLAAPLGATKKNFSDHK